VWQTRSGSFSERFEKIGRGIIKILETWQFGLSFNIIIHVFFLFWPKTFFCLFYEFWKNVGLTHKKIVKLLTVNEAFFNRFSWLSTFFEGNFYDFLIFNCILRIFVNFWFFTDYFLSDFDPRNEAVRDTLNVCFFLWMRYWPVRPTVWHVWYHVIITLSITVHIS
jgi:hypothetical protein